MNLSCHLRHLPAASLLSLNKYLYILKADKGSWKIEAEFEREGAVHFEVTNDWLVLSDESTKLVNFYKLSEFLQTRSIGTPEKTQ